MPRPCLAETRCEGVGFVPCLAETRCEGVGFVREWWKVRGGGGSHYTIIIRSSTCSFLISSLISLPLPPSGGMMTSTTALLKSVTLSSGTAGNTSATLYVWCLHLLWTGRFIHTRYVLEDLTWCSKSLQELVEIL